MKPTFVRVVAVATVVVLAAVPAFAETPLRKSIDRAATAASQASPRPAARGENPYMVPGISLIGGGATLALLGFVMPSGAECTDKSTTTRISVQCGTTANKGLIFAGLGAAGVGGFLLMKGEKQRNSSPTISPTPGGFVVRQRVRF